MMITVIFFRKENKKIKERVMLRSKVCACNLTFFLYANVYLMKWKKLSFIKWHVMKTFFFCLHRLQINPDICIQHLLLSYVKEQFCAQVTYGSSWLWPTVKEFVLISRQNWKLMKKYELVVVWNVWVSRHKQ